MTSQEKKETAMSEEDRLSPEHAPRSEPESIAEGAEYGNPAEQETAREGVSDIDESPPGSEDTQDTVGRIRELEDELSRVKEHMLRALTDAENARKRAQKDREEAGKYAITAFARDLLSFADNFTRALDAIPDDLKDVEPRIANVISGIEAMEKELMNTFEKHGIQRLDPMDEPFDPNFHEVMFEAPATGKPAGTVVQIIEPGYMIKDRLLRPAKVGIAKSMPGEDGASGDNKPGSQIDQEA